jgi:hypothetical protein
MDLSRNTDDEESKKFWETAKRAREKVATWPEWKRNVRVTKYSPGRKDGTTEETE